VKRIAKKDWLVYMRAIKIVLHGFIVVQRTVRQKITASNKYVVALWRSGFLWCYGWKREFEDLL
jgi:hypothetical protein